MIPIYANGSTKVQGTGKIHIHAFTHLNDLCTGGQTPLTTVEMD